MKNGNRPKKSRKKLVLVLVICLAVMLLAAGGLYLYGQSMKNKMDEAMRNQPEDTAADDMFRAAEYDPEHVRTDAANPLISFMDNQIILSAADGASDSDIRAFIAGQGAYLVGYNRWLGKWQVQLPGTCRTREEIRAAGEVYLESGLFTKALPNYVYYMEPDVVKINDTEWANWDEGSLIHWGADAMNLRSMWETLDYVHTYIVKVGIMDGQFYMHDDLEFTATRFNGFDFSMAKNSHGTHVAGIIAAVRDNEKGIAGVASGHEKDIVWLYGYSLNGQANKFNITSFDYDSAIAYLLIEGECQVINLSLGCEYDRVPQELCYDWLLENGIVEDWESYRNYLTESLAEAGEDLVGTLSDLRKVGREFVLVSSAGNDNDKDGVTGEAVFNNIVCAITDQDLRDRIIVVGSAAMKSYGNYKVADTSNWGDRVDLIAPGDDIYSTIVEKSKLSGFPWGDILLSDYGYMSGTSMAAPQVTGAAAAVWSVNPDLTGAEVKEIIVSTAKGSYGYEVRNRPNRYAMLDASAAVDKALEMRGVQPRHPDPELPGNSVATKPRSIIMAIDNSGSMRGRPIEETRKAADRFVDAVYGLNADVAIVRFNSSAYVQAGFSSSLDELHDVVSGFSASGGTDIGRALNKSYEELKNSENRKIIVLMSDGLPESGLKGDALVARADEIKDDGVLIYTLGFFQNPDNRAAQQELMQRIASEGCHYEVDSAENMEVVFADVSQQITGERYIYIRIACPVEVLVEYEGRRLSSADGDRHQRTFYGTLSVEDSPEKKGETIKVLRLREGPDYTVHIWGTGEGTMDYTVGVMDGDGEYTDFRRFDDIPVTEDTVMESVASAGARTSLKVDTDGDGKFDMVYSAGAGSDMGAVNRNKVLAGGGLVILAAAALLLTRARKRTVRQKSVAERENRGM